jgi:hypothetical protein
MNFIISPYKGAGPIQFGMTREEVRNLINSEFKTLAGIELWERFLNLGGCDLYLISSKSNRESILVELIPELSPSRRR